MSRNRLSDIQSPSNTSNGQYYQQDGYHSNDLERNDFAAGERYELQDRSGLPLSLSEYLREVELPA
jgi:hypothetical protein